MRILIFSAVLLFLSCGQNSSDRDKETTAEDTAKTTIVTADTGTAVNESIPVYVIPDEAAVNERLEAAYSNKWHVLNDQGARWMKDAFDYFIVPRRKENPNYPYITKGDYDADGKQDTAAVVTDSLKTTYQVAMLMGSGKVMLWKEDIMEDAALSTIPKSDIDGMEGEKVKKVRLKGEGINVEYFEKAAFVLYWSGREFKRIQTAD